MFLLDMGCKDLIVVGNKQFQKKTMKDLGVPEENYCDSSKEDAYDFIMKRTRNLGADVFFECVGSPEVAGLAVESASPGGSVCFVGNPRSDMTFRQSVYWKILRNQLRISGTWNSSFSGMGEGAEDDWHYVLSRLASKSISPGKLITQRYTLEDIHKGFELMRDRTGEYIKVMCSINREG
jgi:L-iditol 2-dehydrogenase